MPASFKGPAEYNQPRPHPQDSIPPAEHLFPPDLKERLAALGTSAFMTTEARFGRACLHYEYALATPEFEGDAQLFAAGNEDLDYIIASDLPIRSKIRFGASVLRAYEPIFSLRAQSPFSLEVPNELRSDLQIAMGDITADFLEGPELTDTDYGLLSEAVAIIYLLQSDLFPYVATWREEGNIYWKDNHDAYTLHPCKTNRIKKAPASIKHSKHPRSSDAVVVLKVGRLARNIARQIGLNLWGNSATEHQQTITATRYAADIILDAIHDIPITSKAAEFIELLTKSLRDPLVAFAARDTTPDYASNAEALKKEIAARHKHDEHYKRKAPFTQRIQPPTIN